MARASWCVLLCAGACSQTAPAAKVIELEGVRAQVPASWSPSPASTTRRLEVAGRGRDPAAEVRVTAVSADTSRVPSLAIMVIHHSREYTQDATARTMARDSVTAVKLAADARGIVMQPSYSCARQQCSTQMTLGFPEGSVHARAHLWRIDGQVIEVGCMGTDLGAVTACDLPAAPPSADPVPPDAPG
jgi:hypothetical protein